MSQTNLTLILVVQVALLLAYIAIKIQTSLMREALWAGFITGVGGALAVLVWQQVLDQMLPALLPTDFGPIGDRAMLVAALPELFCKLLLLLVLVRHVVRVSDTRDIILASLGVSLGFAAMKEAAFVIQAVHGEMLAPGLPNLLRALSFVPEHAILGLAMGALVGRACRTSKVSLAGLPVAFLVPFVMQGSFEFLMMLYQRQPSAEWALHLLPVAATASVLLSVVISNSVVSPWTRYRERRGPDSASAAAALGTFLVVLGAVALVSMMGPPDDLGRQTAAQLSILLLVLGIDLITTALGRWRPAKPVDTKPVFAAIPLSRR